MPKLTTSERNYAVLLRQAGLGYGSIAKALYKDKNVKVTKRAIKKLCVKYDTLGTVNNKKREYTGKIQEEHLIFINEQIQNDPSSTAKELATAVKERYDISISKSRISVIRQCKLGYKSSKPRYCQMVRDVNKVKRKDFAQQMLDDNEQFDVSYSIKIFAYSIKIFALCKHTFVPVQPNYD